MKLIRHGAPGAEKPGLILKGNLYVDTSAFGEDYDERFFATGGLERLKSWLDQEVHLPPLPPGVRLGPPIVRPSKLICIGLNYAEHAQESSMTLPDEPVIFFKATSAICGPNDDLVMPQGSTKVDWEVEVAVVIGAKASYVTEGEAMDYVAGYTGHIDYSERAFQLERGGQWVKGKSCDTFAPLGPFLATKDEVPDPHHLDLWLTVNGETMQQSSTTYLIFGIPHLISYLSRFMTLLPGDVISTGTPSGVGLGLKPPRYLNPGDIVESGIENLGTTRQVVRAFGE